MGRLRGVQRHEAVGTIAGDLSYHKVPHRMKLLKRTVAMVSNVSVEIQFGAGY